MEDRATWALKALGFVLGLLLACATLGPSHRHAGGVVCHGCTLPSMGRRGDPLPSTAGLFGQGRSAGNDPALRLAIPTRVRQVAVASTSNSTPIGAHPSAAQLPRWTAPLADEWGRRAPPGRAPPLS